MFCRFVFLLLLATLLPGCVKDEQEANPFAPRIPDEAGIVTDITTERLTIDGGKTYEIDRRVESFLTYRPTQAARILEREGQYVHIGVEGDKVVWIGGIGEVIELQGRRVTFYVGTLKQIDGRRMVFADGTTLPLGRGVTRPKANSRLRATIDVTSDDVVELQET